MVFSNELLVEKYISESMVLDPFTPISKAVGLMKEKKTLMKYLHASVIRLEQLQ